MHRSLALVPLLMLLACGGEDLSAPDAEAPDAAPLAPDAFVSGWGCSDTTYRLSSITCWDTDLSTSVTLDDFVAAAADSTMQFQAQPDDTCEIAIRFEGATCAEEQRWTIVDGSEMSSTGITSCAPDGCTFGAADDACAVDDHAATASVGIAVVLDVGDVLLTFDGATGVCADLGYDIEEQLWLVPR